jgi:type I restriction-modification system DNA methylase subunit
MMIIGIKKRDYLYEYMLSKLRTAGMNGQFRLPRHIIKMMTAFLAPGPHEIICDISVRILINKVC